MERAQAAALMIQVVPLFGRDSRMVSGCRKRICPAGPRALEREPIDRDSAPDPITLSENSITENSLVCRRCNRRAQAPTHHHAGRLAGPATTPTPIWLAGVERSEAAGMVSVHLSLGGFSK